MLVIGATGLIGIPIASWGILALLSAAPPFSQFTGAVIQTLRNLFLHHAFLNWLSSFPSYWIIWLPVLIMATNRLLLPPPTHIMVLPEGLMAFRAPSTAMKSVSTLSSHRPFNSNWFERWWEHLSYSVLAKIKWCDLRRISLDRKRSVNGGQIICFHMANKKESKLRLGDVLTQEVRVRLLAALKEWAPDVEVEPEVYDLLEPRPETSFTELWISALSAPPARERIVSLPDRTKLKEGRYLIVEKLASGGQGTIYTATDLQDKASPELVIKEYVLPIHVTREAKKHSIESLENEARLLKKLDNPHIVKLLDFFIEDHRGYLVFERIIGSNLRSLVEKTGPMPEARVRQILKEMLEILAYLHSQNPPLVHRDFAPDNLIFDESTGHIKLIDFNVAQAATDTINAIVVGKRSYMPPEQFRGKAVPESDIYALGACTYFLLTGEEPEALSVLHPKDHTQSISPDLDDLVAKCTQLDVADRYRSANEISAGLE